jgi:hypothetical protein
MQATGRYLNTRPYGGTLYGPRNRKAVTSVKDQQTDATPENEQADATAPAVEENETGAASEANGAGDRLREGAAFLRALSAMADKEQPSGFRVDLADLIYALDLEQPVRAALGAAARSLAESLNDGEAGDAGPRPATENTPGTPRRQVIEVGGEPFVLLRVTRVDGTEYGALSLVSGGGIVPDAKAGPDDLTVEYVLREALDGVTGASSLTASEVPDAKVLKEMAKIAFGTGILRNPQCDTPEDDLPRAGPVRDDGEESLFPATAAEGWVPTFFRRPAGRSPATAAGGGDSPVPGSEGRPLGE